MSVRGMTRPWWRIRYSRTAYSLGVSSMALPPRRTSRLPVSSVRSATVRAGLDQAPLDVLPDGPVVFDDEDLHPTGRYTLNVEPTPTCDSTSMRPRCSAMIP